MDFVTPDYGAGKRYSNFGRQPTHLRDMIYKSLIGFLLLFGILTASGEVAVADNYFKTPYQDESQYIVETVISDVAEQIYFAKYHRLPDAGVFSVVAAEATNSPVDSPKYDLVVDLDQSHRGLKLRLNVDAAIWSPEIYDAIATGIAQAIGLPANTNSPVDDTALLARLEDARATTLERENQRISAALQNDFANSFLHEESAVLLGAFALREHSGDFFDIRFPLCRMTSHLIMARLLGGDASGGINGEVAKTMLLTLVNNETDAIESLKRIQTNNPAVRCWVRSLQAWNTSDYRSLDAAGGLAPVECIAWFGALEGCANTDMAWDKLSDPQKRSPDFVRIANARGYSVGVGHEIIEVSLPVEMAEEQAVFRLSKADSLSRSNLVIALNQFPDRCLSAAGTSPQVHIISWGLWAGFFQRHLCSAIKSDFNLLQREWGVPDDARDFAQKCNASFNGLRLYPFVRQMNATDEGEYRLSQNEAYKVTVDNPENRAGWLLVVFDS